MSDNIVIYGAGQNGRVVLDILRSQSNHQVAGFIDDNKNLLAEKINSVPVLGDSTCLKRLATNDHFTNAFISIGDNRIRATKAALLKKNGFDLINIIHKSAIISENIEIGNNVQISAGVIINTNSKIGNNVIINTAATLDHDNELENNVQICPGVHLAGAVKIKEYTFVGIGAIVINAVTIGKNVIIGAGTLILNDIPDNAVVTGVPGKIRKYREA